MEKDRERYLVFTGGGTGGHVFPGLAVAEALSRRLQTRMVWLGSPGGIEEELVRRAGVPGLVFRGIPSGKFRRYLSLKNLTDMFRILGAFLRCWTMFKRNRPAAVFSKGGYVTVPPVWAAGIQGIPVYSHESDFDPGLATRLNLRYTKRLFVAYPETVDYLPAGLRKRAVVSGNPIRTAILAGDANKLEQWFPGCRSGRAKDLPLLAVLGGSLGALQLNELVAAALPELKGRAVVIHQHGKNWEAPDEVPGFYYPRAFLTEEMAHLLAAADLAAARAGAGTLWELAAWKVPAVLVPLTEGSRGDQVRNAKYFADAGTCLTLANPSDPDFAAALLKLCTDRSIRERMARGYNKFSFTADQTISEALYKELAQ